MTGDLRTGTDKHYSMKAIHDTTPERLRASISRAENTIDMAARESRQGGTPLPVLIDLTKVRDVGLRVEVRARLLTRSTEANAALAASANPSVEVVFVE